MLYQWGTIIHSSISWLSVPFLEEVCVWSLCSPNAGLVCGPSLEGWSLRQALCQAPSHQEVAPFCSVTYRSFQRPTESMTGETGRLDPKILTQGWEVQGICQEVFFEIQGGHKSFVVRNKKCTKERNFTKVSVSSRKKEVNQGSHGMRRKRGGWGTQQVWHLEVRNPGSNAGIVMLCGFGKVTWPLWALSFLIFRIKVLRMSPSRVGWEIQKKKELRSTTCRGILKLIVSPRAGKESSWIHYIYVFLSLSISLLVPVMTLC